MEMLSVKGTALKITLDIRELKQACCVVNRGAAVSAFDLRQRSEYFEQFVCATCGTGSSH